MHDVYAVSKHFAVVTIVDRYAFTITQLHLSQIGCIYAILVIKIIKIF